MRTTTDPELRLNALHRELLLASAIDPEVALADYGVRTVMDTDRLPAPLRQNRAAAVPGLLFPLLNIDLQTRWQFRPNMPLIADNGRELKYVQESGVGSIFAIDPLWSSSPDVWSEGIPHDTVIVVEGTKRAIAIRECLRSTNEAVETIGILGAWNWGREGLASKAFIEQLGRRVPRRVEILFDADVRHNPDVWKSGSRLATVLGLQLGIEEVVFLDVSTINGTDRQGIDDVLGNLPAALRPGAVQRLREHSTPDLGPEPLSRTKAKGPVAKVSSKRDDRAELNKSFSATREAIGVMLSCLGGYPRDEAERLWAHADPNAYLTDAIIQVGSMGKPHRAQFLRGPWAEKLQIDLTKADEGLTAWDLLLLMCEGDEILASRVLEAHVDGQGFHLSNLEATLTEDCPDLESLLATYPAAGHPGEVLFAGDVSDIQLPDRTVPFPHPEEIERCARLPRDQIGAAQRVAAYMKDHLYFTADNGMWRLWNGRLFEPIDEHDVRAIIKGIIDAISSCESSCLPPAAKPEKSKGEDDRHREWAMTLRTPAVVDGLLRHLPSTPGIKVAQAFWIPDPDTLNCRDGVVDLRTGVLSAHDPKYRCTQIAKGSGRIDLAPTPDLQLVLDQFIKTDAEMPRVIERAFGLACTGHTAKYFSHWYGVPNAGKSTLPGALEAALGGGHVGLATANRGYAARLSSSDLMPMAPGAPRDGLMGVENMRLLTVDEASHARLDWDLVKKLSGDDETITTRGLYGRTAAWRSMVTLIMTGNDELAIDASDAGIEARFYPVRIDHAPPVLDPELASRLRTRTDNLDAVLALGIRGAKAWYDEGRPIRHAMPDFIEQMRANYLREANPVTSWMEECVTFVPAHGTPGCTKPIGAYPTLSEAHANYASWAKEHGRVRPMSNRALKSLMKGVRVERTTGLRNGQAKSVDWCLNIELKPTSNWV
jgi:phage/plasmid-associated DNA primase